MEPRKGADGLIAPLAKVASAGGILALATAAFLLALAGCGGDSGSEEDSAQAQAERSAQAREASPQGAAGKTVATAGANSGAQGAGEGQATAQGDSADAKQSPPIAAPEGAPEQGLTPEQRETAKLASISLQSPALLPVAGAPGELPSTYTCEGKDSWPTLRWRGVPEGTAELVLFAMSLAPVEGKLFFNWALAGIDPGTEEIEAARLPQGATVGQNSYGRRGYSICPAKGEGETYFFALYALPERLSARPGFDPRALRAQVQELSRNVGILPLTYARAG